MLTKLYRKYVSQNVRNKIYDVFLGDVLRITRNVARNCQMKCYWLFQFFLPDTEKNRCYIFMGRHKFMSLPYPFRLEYDKKNIDCQFDNNLSMFFVIHNNKKLYFPKNFKKRKIIAAYRDLIAEQDSRSPHCYVRHINQLQGKTLLDIGAAEAIFSLDTIELTNKVYLFECNEEWIEAQKATFAPWEEKVEIVKKYVSDTNSETTITIDHFLEEREKSNLFVKMDIEGYEQAALRGAENTFSEADIDFSIATYHRKDDVQNISQFLQAHNLEYEQTEGFICWAWANGDLREAIIRRKI